jgi:hypothetical protein
MRLTPDCRDLLDKMFDTNQVRTPGRPCLSCRGRLRWSGTGQHRTRLACPCAGLISGHLRSLPGSAAVAHVEGLWLCAVPAGEHKKWLPHMCSVSSAMGFAFALPFTCGSCSLLAVLVCADCVARLLQTSLITIDGSVRHPWLSILPVISLHSLRVQSADCVCGQLLNVIVCLTCCRTLASPSTALFATPGSAGSCQPSECADQRSSPLHSVTRQLFIAT